MKKQLKTAAATSELAYGPPRPVIPEARKSDLRRTLQRERADTLEIIVPLKEKTKSITTDSDKIMDEMLLGNYRNRLAALDHCLDLLRDDEYGICSSCHGQIEVEKLRAYFKTSTCRTCDRRAHEEYVTVLTDLTEEQRIRRHLPVLASRN